MSNSIVASVGLVSDTHYQERLFDLPVGLQEQWADIDLILHAGDIGNLEMLDLLGTFAPTVAVHGNDEPERVKEALPYQQLVTVHAHASCSGTATMLIQSQNKRIVIARGDQS